jgi:hypothetical protein
MARPSRYIFDDKSQRYIDRRTRRAVRERAVLAEQRKLIDASKRRIDKLVDQYFKDRNRAAYLTAMRDEAKLVHSTSIALARGGRANMTQADWGRAGAQLKKHYQRLNRLGLQLETGAQSDAGLRARSRLYAQSSRQSYDLAKRQAMGAAGYSQARAILTSAEHCDGCTARARKGWMPLAEFPPLCSLECGPNDQCDVEYR